MVDNTSRDGNVPVNPILLADDREREIWDYAAPKHYDFNLDIVKPAIEADKFELKPVMFQMLTAAGQFGVVRQKTHIRIWNPS